MISQKGKAWIDAAKKIASNSSQEVACPNCGYEFLTVEKVPWPNFDKVDIHMSCKKCKAQNVITTSMLHTA